ncbi:uncharacterized protein LOC143193599 [Rhynchophorus ferrugineus]|uniref:uncharacterized protein LOC143193599 n=1 Tax=Rhynchophorus ferrugineus TaxID=354439 RepID=UPI003FCC3E7E
MKFVQGLLVTAVLWVSNVVGSSNEEQKTPFIFKLLTPYADDAHFKICLTENDLTIDDLVTKGQQHQFSEKKLCYIKCMSLKAGTLTQDGTILTDKVKESLSQIEIFTPSDVDTITTCLRNITDKIITCNDTNKMIKCFKPPNSQQ